MHEGSRRDDTTVLADDGVDLAAQREDQELIGMVMQLGAGSRILVEQAEIHVLPVDYRRLPGGKMRREILAFDVLEAVK